MIVGTGSFALLILSLRSLPLGSAYTGWTDMGVTVIGIVAFIESAPRPHSIVLVVVVIVNLKLSHTD
ncbi:MAG: SMR family transporter [Gammaproteobacteria bacterium]